MNSLFKRRFLYRRRRCFLRLGATEVYSFFPRLFTVQEVFIHGKVTKNLDLRWLDTVLQGQYLPSLSIKLRRHKQSFGKIATAVVLDEDENLL